MYSYKSQTLTGVGAAVAGESWSKSVRIRTSQEGVVIQLPESTDKQKSIRLGDCVRVCIYCILNYLTLVAGAENLRLEA